MKDLLLTKDEKINWAFIVLFVVSGLIINVTTYFTKSYFADIIVYSLINTLTMGGIYIVWAILVKKHPTGNVLNSLMIGGILAGLVLITRLINDTINGYLLDNDVKGLLAAFVYPFFIFSITTFVDRKYRNRFNNKILFFALVMAGINIIYYPINALFHDGIGFWSNILLQTTWLFRMALIPIIGSIFGISFIRIESQTKKGKINQLTTQIKEKLAEGLRKREIFEMVHSENSDLDERELAKIFNGLPDRKAFNNTKILNVVLVILLTVSLFYSFSIIEPNLLNVSSVNFSSSRYLVQFLFFLVPLVAFIWKLYLVTELAERKPNAYKILAIFLCLGGGYSLIFGAGYGLREPILNGALTLLVALIIISVGRQVYLYHRILGPKKDIRGNYVL